MKLYFEDDQVQIFHGDIRDGLPVAAGSASAVVTSPPYNVGIDYDDHDDSLGLAAYANAMRSAAAEMARLLHDGGRCWVNVAPIVTTASPWAIRVALAERWSTWLLGADLWLHDQIAWVYQRDPDTAWGSWSSPSAPNLRGAWETILVASKGPEWKRQAPAGMEGWRDTVGEWTPLTSNVWRINPNVTMTIRHRSRSSCPPGASGCRPGQVRR